MVCSMKSLAVIATLLCLATAISQAEVKAADTTIPLRLTPAEINVNTFYRGTDVRIQADVPNCDGAVLLVASAGKEITLSRMGRRAGIWLNVAQVTVKGAPEVYMFASSEPLGHMCSEGLGRELGLGLESLRDRISVTSEKPLAGTEVDEFLKLKKKTGTYITDLGITLTPEGKERQKLLAMLPVPASVPPGHYQVELYCFRNGEVVSRVISHLNIRNVGLVKIMATLARRHAATYGLLAIVVAMSAGLVISFLFHFLPGSGH
jgi:uncharacterized protein (TIGR02186 family)